MHNFVLIFRLRTDHNEDQTIEVLYQWLYKWSKAYHHVDIEYDNTTQQRQSETSPTQWSDERYLDVIRMKEEALNYGRKIWADYIFVSAILSVCLNLRRKKNIEKKFIFLCFSFSTLMCS